MMAVRLAGPPLLVQALVIGVPASALLWTLTTDLHPSGWRLRGLRGLSWPAESSYSLYAIHMPLVVLLAAWLTPQRDDRWARRVLPGGRRTQVPSAGTRATVEPLVVD
jgi:peptidoglycan/LPS O-acetylase OafA/YrhL